MRQAVLRGVKRRQQDRVAASYRYFEVVYGRAGDEVFVITVKPRW